MQRGKEEAKSQIGFGEFNFPRRRKTFKREGGRSDGKKFCCILWVGRQRKLNEETNERVEIISILCRFNDSSSRVQYVLRETLGPHFDRKYLRIDRKQISLLTGLVQESPQFILDQEEN